MTILINTNHSLTAGEKFKAPFIALISGELKRFSDHITRVEVYLTDENGGKSSPDDKKCTIEARIEGKQPVAVTSHGNTYEQAVNATVEKLTGMLYTIFDRLKSH